MLHYFNLHSSTFHHNIHHSPDGKGDHRLRMSEVNIGDNGNVNKFALCSYHLDDEFVRCLARFLKSPHHDTLHSAEVRQMNKRLKIAIKVDDF